MKKEARIGPFCKKKIASLAHDKECTMIIVMELFIVTSLYFLALIKSVGFNHCVVSGD